MAISNLFDCCLQKIKKWESGKLEDRFLPIFAFLLSISEDKVKVVKGGV